MDKRHIREKAEPSASRTSTFTRTADGSSPRQKKPASPNIISTVVGHAEGFQGMTLGVYSGGPSLDQLRACVGAVRLPARL